MRQVYLAATGQNRGKTTAALGCLDGFFREGLAPGFMKPVGQRTVIQDGVAAAKRKREELEATAARKMQRATNLED